MPPITPNLPVHHVDSDSPHTNALLKDPSLPATKEAVTITGPQGSGVFLPSTATLYGWAKKLQLRLYALISRVMPAEETVTAGPAMAAEETASTTAPAPGSIGHADTTTAAEQPSTTAPAEPKSTDTPSQSVAASSLEDAAGPRDTGSTVAAASAPVPPPTLPSLPGSHFEQPLFDGINAERTKAGLPPLAVDVTLVAVARARSQDMATYSYFGHYRPDGSLALQLLLAEYQVTFSLAGENIARNNYADHESPSVALRDLMASPPHRDNILRPQYTKVGVGVYLDSQGMKYFTIVFTAD